MAQFKCPHCKKKRKRPGLGASKGSKCLRCSLFGAFLHSSFESIVKQKSMIELRDYVRKWYTNNEV